MINCEMNQINELFTLMKEYHTKLMHREKRIYESKLM